MVPLADISPAQPFQVRERPSLKIVKDYATAMAQGREFPAVKLGILDDALVCLGGHHRIAAARRIGRGEILADIYTVDHAQAARIAFDDNRTNALHMSKDDRRKALDMFVKHGLHKLGRGKVMSSRMLADEIGGAVHHDTILTWMAEDNPGVWAKMQRGRAKARGSGEFNYRKKHAEDAKQAALDAVAACLASARGAKAPKARGEIRAALLDAAAQVAKLGKYVPPEESPAGSDF